MYYQIEGTGLRLLGSIHLFPASAPGMPQRCWDALTWPTHTMFESSLTGLVPHMQLAPGESLADLIPPDVYAALEPAWFGKPQALPLPRLKPWAAMLAASVISLRFQPGVEMLFQQQLPPGSYGYLETDDQLGMLFDSVPLTAVLEGLRRTLAMLPRMQQCFEESYESWVRWDVPALLDGQRARPIGAVEELRRAVLIQRNRDWAEQIAGFPKDGTRYLFVAGYEHLVGPESVVELLEEKGMKLSLVPQ